MTYRPGVALHAQVTRVTREGPLRVRQLSYTSVDGQRVPALFTVPAGEPPLGCLVYQGGLGQTKEQFPQLREGAGRLRLATFTIDPRDGGARGSVAKMVAALKTPQTLLAMVLDTVVDLRVGLDYLESRPQCHHDIAYLGTSFGGVVGAILAAQDPRVKAVILTSIGATFEQAMLVGAEAAKGIHDLPVQVPGAASSPSLLARAVRVLSPYDPEKMVPRIAPRPLMLIEGRFDPLVPPVDALQLAQAAQEPKTVVYFNGGHDPFAPGPGYKTVLVQLAQFLVANLNLPF
ncbi:MAG: alpha/beta hydrolase [Solirubrobacteraceae bacterium]